MNVNWISFITIIFLFPFTILFGLPLVPRVVNYTNSEYQAGNQNWSITQDKDGRIYVGNTNGVLEFDGLHWRLYSMPNNDVVRCVYFSTDGKLYAGSYEEFGFFTRNTKNQLEYHSLSEKLSDYKLYNDEIWNIAEYNGKVYFQYFSSYFEYDGNTVKGHKGTAPLNLFKYKDRLFAQLINKGLSVYTGNAFKEIISSNKYGNSEVVTLLPLRENSILITRNKGIFLHNDSDSTVTAWNCEINDELKKYSVNKACMTKDSCYIIGTLSNGIYAINNTGKLLWKINEENALINNTILGLFCDAENNIWAAMDNGISRIYYNSDISLFKPDFHHFGMVYDALVLDDEVYIASNQGLYHYLNKTGEFQKIPGIEGQTYSISKIDGQLICGHNAGSFRIENGHPVCLSTTKGARSIIRCNIHNQDILLQNTYTYLNIYRKDNSGNWIYGNRINKFIHLIQNIEVDHAGNIWAQHMHKGIYQIRLNESLTEAVSIKYYNKLSKKENIKINIFKIFGRIVLSGEEGFFTYDDLNDSIIPYNQLNKELPSLRNCYKVVHSNNNECWVIDNSNYSLVRYSNGHFNIVRQIALSSFVDHSPIDHAGNIFFNKKNEIFFAFNGALAYYSGIKPYKSTPTPIFKIKEVSAGNGNNSLDDYYLPIDNGGKINFNHNHLSISLYCPMLKENACKVRYKLDGLDNKNTWHTDLKALQKEYSRLPYGKYCFKAELFDNQQHTISNIEYPFTIQRPFYLSYTALSIYVILGAALFFLLIRIITNQSNKKKNKQIEQQQKQITELEKEHLKSELLLKSKDLANFTMQSIKYNEFLFHIKKALQGQRLKGQTSKLFFDNLTRSIDENITSNDDWALFQSNFDRIHENFFRNLKKNYPALTPNDLKLCALLRLNLNTKDICNMMNVSLRGIEAARYRLRKKLNIPIDQNLVDFMIQFK